MEEIARVSEKQAPTCQVCGEIISDNDKVECAKCRTPHHRDCWSYMEKCSTFGCDSQNIYGPPPMQLTPGADSPKTFEIGCDFFDNNANDSLLINNFHHAKNCECNQCWDKRYRLWVYLIITLISVSGVIAFATIISYYMHKK